MESTFKNLDENYNRMKREYEGDIQPKFWYRGTKSDHNLVLVKRQSSQSMGKNQPKSRMYNHIGEYFGYLIAKQANVKACPVDLVVMHDTKNKYSKTVQLFTGCASHNLQRSGTTMIPGEMLINAFFYENKSQAQKILNQTSSKGELCAAEIMNESVENNIDLIIASVINKTLEFERKCEKRTEQQVVEDVENNVKDLIDMAVYDCIFGNHDRHSRNWAMELDTDSGQVKVYPAYDNEAVLGLRRPEAEIQGIVDTPETMQEETDKVLCSRMGFGKVKSGILYTDMLNYLVKKYPKYAIPSIQKITSNVDEKFIEDLYDDIQGISGRGEFSEEMTEADELPEAYRIFGMNAFKTRREYAKKLLRVRSDIDTRQNNIVMNGNNQDKTTGEEIEFI